MGSPPTKKPQVSSLPLDGAARRGVAALFDAEVYCDCPLLKRAAIMDIKHNVR
jgi:hypothetical protein